MASSNRLGPFGQLIRALLPMACHLRSMTRAPSSRCGCRGTERGVAKERSDCAQLRCRAAYRALGNPIREPGTDARGSGRLDEHFEGVPFVIRPSVDDASSDLLARISHVLNSTSADLGCTQGEWHGNSRRILKEDVPA